MLNRFTQLSLLLPLALLAGCSNDFSPLRGTAVFEETTPAPVVPTRVLVMGDANSPVLADFLRGKGMDVLDVPYSPYAASEDLKISGDYIVWSDNRNGDLDIYAYQISTGKEFAVARKPGNQWRPSIAGDYIVWEDYRDNNADIYGYQISGAKEFVISADPQNQLFPQTDGKNVVWQDQGSGSADIYRFALSGAGGTKYPVATGSGDQKHPQISENHIVWENFENGYNDIFLYTIGSSDAPLNLTYSAAFDGSQYQPRIDGDYVVWLDNSSTANGTDIYAYRIPGSVIIQVAVALEQQIHPRLSGSRVVWQDNRNGDFDIYARDLNGGSEMRLNSVTAGDQIMAQISADLVVWQDGRSGNNDVYAYSFASGRERRVTTDITEQTRPQADSGRIIWLDQRRGVTDVVWSGDFGISRGVATNTWLTPAGMVGDIADYDVMVVANDFVSDAVVLNLYDTAIAAGVGVVGLGGTGTSLARVLAEAGRYGIEVTPASGCAEMEITATTDDEFHPLFLGTDVTERITLENTDAKSRDELAIRTDTSKLDSPVTWRTQALFSYTMCNAFKGALVEFKDGKSLIMLDGAATMADGYVYWSADRWDLFLNEVNYVKPVKPKK